MCRQASKAGNECIRTRGSLPWNRACAYTPLALGDEASTSWKRRTRWEASSAATLGNTADRVNINEMYASRYTSPCTSRPTIRPSASASPSASLQTITTDYQAQSLEGPLLYPELVKPASPTHTLARVNMT
ncbi:hypothetical protein BDZ91DRAFT_758242 [Kalaharituber pfeilii]|nr:hypothetical protein BDZ91DRAFT_758242 [Kalaharituber pfeilii]